MKLLVSAIEPSSNKYLKVIAQHLEDTQLFGLAHRDIVPNSLYDLDNFSVMGIASVLPKIFFFKKVIKEMIDLSLDCDAVLFIDAPSFNLRIAKGIKEKYPNKPIFYYILPKIWAWKKSRLGLIEKYTDYHISILPFENKFYSKCIYLGNPLLDEYAKNTVDFSKNKYIAFLPGSRKSEIKALMPIFRDVAKKICNRDKEAIIVIPDIFDKEYIENLYGDLSDFKIINNTKEAFSISSFAFVCSGTATFEATLSSIPFVLCYSFKGIDLLLYHLFFNIFNKQGLGAIGYAGLANIISHFESKPQIHKEVLPHVTSDALLDVYNNFDYKKHFENIELFREIMGTRENKNSLEKVANFILEKNSGT